MKVSFDFDGTLSRKDVQDYAASLIKKGHDVWITTARYDDDNKHRWKINPTNKELYEISDKLGIPREKIIFCNLNWKSEIMPKDFIWHLDDDWLELNKINKEMNFPGISVFGNSTWKNKCNKLLNNDN